MFFNSIILIIICSIILIFIASQKQKIIKKYGKPINFFVASTFSCQFRISAINLAITAIYNDKIVISIDNEDILINKENFVSFDEPTFLKPCTIKFKVANIYQTRSISFSIISKKQIEKIKYVLNNF